MRPFNPFSLFCSLFGCTAFFWVAANRNDWLAGVAAGTFLAALILDLAAWSRSR